MIDKTYNPHDIESDIYAQWEASGAFAAQPEDKTRPIYAIMMPPPNVTGSLHMGHALNHTLQDILVRYHRMRGYNVLWQPGTDHAGIATQSVVERQMDQEGLTRHDLGREKFLERVWQWKAHSGGTIVRQLRRLGVSPDWSRERFTMDDGLSEAVRKVFVQLYRENLIYRDKRLVNWDPKLHTAISDLEVQNVETHGKMYHIRYPLQGEEGQFITVATTRPETLFGDVAVAVHPEDSRYQHLIGRYVQLPLTDRVLPIIADEYCDPEKGTGAVKITPAHDFNDFEVGRRHGLESINIMTSDACLNDFVPVAYRGLDRFVAREKVIADLEVQGLFEGSKETIHMVPYSERTGQVVEPYLTDQWFVDAATLAQPALEAVKDGRTRFVPKNWENTYFEWLNNIQPWCISRQLWWGHRIPAWFAPDGKIFVAHDEAEAQELARAHYGEDVALKQDEDVLDTWFSSALWPFSTLGWPEQTEALQQYYPSSVLITGHDIIFFWVARMMMMGLHFMGDVPFKDVCITALVRDEKGQKMSKSKGNVVDPLAFIDTYGADALRFSLAALAGPGRDVNFSQSQVEGYRNFATKVWNVFRFCAHNGCALKADFDPTNVSHSLNKWIVSQIASLSRTIQADLAHYRFDDACSHLYHFVWGRFCDWYVEFIKPLLQDDAPEKAETQATVAWALSQILHMLHPFMPYLTEKLWTELSHAQGLLISAHWPTLEKISDENEIAREIEWVIDFISQVRLMRNALNIAPGKPLSLMYQQVQPFAQEMISKYEIVLKRLARLESLKQDTTPAQAIQLIFEGDTFFVDVEGVLDLEAERKRMTDQLKALEKELNQLESKLSNKDFLAKAPEDVVNKNQQRLAEAQAQQREITQALHRLSV